MKKKNDDFIFEEEEEEEEQSTKNKIHCVYVKNTRSTTEIIIEIVSDKFKIIKTLFTYGQYIYCFIFSLILV